MRSLGELPPRRSMLGHTVTLLRGEGAPFYSKMFSSIFGANCSLIQCEPAAYLPQGKLKGKTMPLFPTPTPVSLGLIKLLFLSRTSWIPTEDIALISELSTVMNTT